MAFEKVVDDPEKRDDQQIEAAVGALRGGKDCDEGILKVVYSWSCERVVI